MSSIFLEELIFDGQADVAKAGCVPGLGGVPTKGISQCDGKTTVFYNGCCMRRGAACGSGKSRGYLGQAKDNPRRGVCLPFTGGKTVNTAPLKTQCWTGIIDNKGTRKQVCIQGVSRADARREFCKRYGKNGRCHGESATVGTNPASGCPNCEGLAALNPACHAEKATCEAGVGAGKVADKAAGALDWCRQIPPGNDFWCDPSRQFMGMIATGGLLLLFLLKR